MSASRIRSDAIAQAGLNADAAMRHNSRLVTSDMAITMRFLPLLLAALLAACTAPKPAPDTFSDAEEALQAATDAGAEEHAPVELRFALEKIAAAQTAMAEKKYADVTNLVEQSEINSELAIEKSKTALIRAKVTDLSRQNEILREDFEATYGEDVQ